MATWGWLMIAPVSRVPNGPALVIEKVPPLMSSRLSRLVRARSASVADPAGHAPQVELLGAVDHRDDQALVVEVDGDPEVDVVVDDEGVVAHRGVEVGEFGQRLDRRPGDEGQVGEG